MNRIALLSIATLCGTASAQDLTEGNGLGKAFMSSTPAVLGGTLDIALGSPDAPNAGVILSVSDGAQISPSVVGLVALDTSSPAYFIVSYPTDANGRFEFSVPWPNDLALYSLPALYGNALTVDPGPVISWSKTVRVSWETSGGWTATGDMSEPRAMHEATALGTGPEDNRTKVFVSGGGTGSIIIPIASPTTEIYDMLTRSFTPGPSMNEARAEHRAIRLNDGRVLITGGAATGGGVTTTCEIYDHDANTISYVASMNHPRVGHELSLLPDGRVLATGGFSDWTDAAINFVAVNNSARRSMEIYDPIADTWTLSPNTMADDRAGHTHTTLPDGRILIVGGVNGGIFGSFGGEYPVMTATCEIYDPATGILTATDPLPGLPSPFGPVEQGRAFHGASLLPGGDVLVTGGIYFAGDQIGASALATSLRWDGVEWLDSGGLPSVTAWHTQVASGQTGEAIIAGGFDGLLTLGSRDASGTHDGTVYADGELIGIQPAVLGSFSVPRGNHSFTPLADGTYLLLGGSDEFNIRKGGFLYTE